MEHADIAYRSAVDYATLFLRRRLIITPPAPRHMPPFAFIRYLAAIAGYAAKILLLPCRQMPLRLRAMSHAYAVTPLIFYCRCQCRYTKCFRRFTLSPLHIILLCRHCSRAIDIAQPRFAAIISLRRCRRHI